MGSESLFYLVIGCGIAFSLIVSTAIYFIGKRPGPDGRYPVGHWSGLGLGIGLTFCVPLGIVFGMLVENIVIGIALGPSLGTSLGLSFGQALREKYKHLERPMTPVEKQRRKYYLITGSAMVVVGMVIFSTVLLSRL